MSQCAVEVVARFLLGGIETPQEALEWLNSTDMQRPSRSLGHVQWVFLIDPHDRAFRKRDIAAYHAGAGIGWPLVSRWSPAAWPARTLATRL